MAATDSTTMKKGTRIVATTELPGVPEGTAGKVGRSVGMTLVRYRVAFDNGAEMTSVAASKLVAEGDWDDFKANREREAAEAAEKASKPAAAPSTDAAPEADAGGGSPADDRLAALLARSKAAREKKA
jgi:hypothetical protein